VFAGLQDAKETAETAARNTGRALYRILFPKLLWLTGARLTELVIFSRSLLSAIITLFRGRNI
jgi:hypothetical protein